MGLKVTFITSTRTIVIDQAPTLENGDWVVDINVKDDLYSDGKEDWLADEALRKLRFPISPVGGQPKPGGFLGSTFFIADDWSIRPYDADHRLRVSGNLYRPDGTTPFEARTGRTINIERDISAIVEGIEVGGGSPSAIAAAVWDEVLTGNTHNIQKSAGKLLRNLGNLVVHTDTAQGPAVNGNQIKLAAAASAIDGAYDPSLIAIVDGTGAGQSRLIFQYEGSSRIATVDRTWKVEPDNTSEYVIYANAGREHVNEGLCQGGTASTVTLNALASSVDDVYLHQTIFIRSGTGEDQVGIVTAYDGTTKVATIDGTWAVIPDTTSAYAMLPSRNNVLTEQFTAYGGAITIDAINGSPGTSYPFGTGETPVSNLANALVIGAKYGIDRYRVANTLVVGATDVVDEKVFEGLNENATTVVLTLGCSTVKSTFRNMTLTGAFGGSAFVERCAVVNPANIGSDTLPVLFNDCVLLSGAVTFRAGLSTPQNIQFKDCTAGQGQALVFDLAGVTGEVGLRKFGGEVIVRNHTGGQNTTWEFDQGAITFEASCDSGVATVRGGAELTDDSTSPMVVLFAGSSGGFTPTDRAMVTLIKDLIEADYDATTNQLVIKHRTSGLVLLTKTITGGDVVPVDLADP